MKHTFYIIWYCGIDRNFILHFSGITFIYYFWKTKYKCMTLIKCICIGGYSQKGISLWIDKIFVYGFTPRIHNKVILHFSFCNLFLNDIEQYPELKIVLQCVLKMSLLFISAFEICNFNKNLMRMKSDFSYNKWEWKIYHFY